MVQLIPPHQSPVSIEYPQRCASLLMCFGRLHDFLKGRAVIKGINITAGHLYVPISHASRWYTISFGSNLKHRFAIGADITNLLRYAFAKSITIQHITSWVTATICFPSSSIAKKERHGQLQYICNRR